MTSIQLINQFRVTVEGEPVTQFRSDKARALLAYVAAQPEQAHSRNSLATLLWPNMPDKSSRANLRIVLSNLRKIAPGVLTISRQTMQLAEGVTVDVGTAREAISADDLDTLITFYTGYFLRGFTLNDARAFEEWVLITRESLRIDVMRFLDSHLSRLTDEQAWERVIEVAGRQLELQAWHESAHQRLMRAYAERGQHRQVKAQYERCRAILQSELGCEPSAATTALRDRLAKSAVTHHLPSNMTGFIGRAQEVAAIRAAVEAHRLVTVSGMGGVGKTRVGVRVAETLVEQFDGVYFVSLVGVITAEAVAMAILSRTGHALHGAASPLAQMTTRLREQRLLLVLDNVEQLVGLAADFLLPLLQHTPVHLLLTSRTGVHIADEQVVRLRGLPLNEAIELFHKRAPVRLADSKYAVRRICQQVEGLPLGIELAAHWTEHFSTTELADILSEDATFLHSGAEGRHRSLRAVYEHSWTYLSQQERTVLAQLSVFRGSFGRSAVLAVTDASLSHISQLINKSLVQRVAAGRYQLHEVVRELSAEKLPSADPTHANHCAFYLASEKTSIDRDDIDNVRAAWRWLTAREDSARLREHHHTFQTLMFQHGLLHETLNLVEAAEQVAIRCGDPNTQAELLWTQHDILRRIEGKASAIDALERALTLATEPNLLSRIHGDLANELVEVGRWSEGEPHFLEQERLARQTEEPRTIVIALYNHASVQVLFFVGSFPAAIGRLNEALALAKAQLPPNDPTRLKVLHGLVTAYMRYGDYASGIRVGEEQVAAAAQTGDPIDLIDALLGSSLPYDFAGLSERAIENEQRGLRLAREVSDWEAVGLLQTNLSMAYRHAGDLEAAKAYGAEAIKLLGELGIRRMLGMAQNRQAHTLLALEKVDAAHAMYRAAVETWRPMEHPNINEARAGLAVTLAKREELTEAATLAEQVLQFGLADNLHKVVEPILMLAHCAEAFALLGNAGQVQRVVALGKTWIAIIANRIEDAEIRSAYLNQVRSHHVLLGFA